MTEFAVNKDSGIIQMKMEKILIVVDLLTMKDGLLIMKL